MFWMKWDLTMLHVCRGRCSNCLPLASLISWNLRGAHVFFEVLGLSFAFLIYGVVIPMPYCVTQVDFELVNWYFCLTCADCRHAWANWTKALKKTVQEVDGGRISGISTIFAAWRIPGYLDSKTNGLERWLNRNTWCFYGNPRLISSTHMEAHNHL